MMSGNESSSVVKEKCYFGKSAVELPQVLCEKEEIFAGVCNIDTWNNLTDGQRTHLMKFLPSFPKDDQTEKEATIRKLFSGEDFKFENPLQQFHKQLKDGLYSEGMKKMASLIRNAKYKDYRYQQQHYFCKLLQDILVSRKKLLDAAAKLPPDQPVKMERLQPQPPLKSSVEERTKKRYYMELEEVREEVGDVETSSEDENYPEGSPPKMTKKQKKQLCHFESALSPDITRISSTFSSKSGTSENGNCSNNMRAMSPFEVSEEYYREMLLQHKRWRTGKEEHPELDTSNVVLQELVARTNMTKRTLPRLASDVSSKKRVKVKSKLDKKKKKTSPKVSTPVMDLDIQIKTEPEERPPSTEPMETSAIEPDPVIEKEIPANHVCSPSPSVIQDIFMSFFSLIRDIICKSSEQRISASKLEEEVRLWQEGPFGALNEWYTQHVSWPDQVLSALKFLAGDMPGIHPENFVPFIDYKEKIQMWQWIGVGRDSDENMANLCKIWVENKEDIPFLDIVDMAGSPPPPRVMTEWTVRPTTEEERELYRQQERIRYENPHKAFTFRMHDYESVVGPVKGVYGKENAVNKAREHSLLVSDRPAFVTILSLVRDSASRLPNGEGTRADICELLKDSQYLSPTSDSQVHTVVSGALDRLHYEKDPCVKYDVNRKLWIYLHRNRTEEEFERIHQAQAAAVKAKKTVQKTKTPRSCVLEMTVIPKPKATKKTKEAPRVALSQSAVVEVAAATACIEVTTTSSTVTTTSTNSIPAARIATCSAGIGSNPTSRIATSSITIGTNPSGHIATRTTNITSIPTSRIVTSSAIINSNPTSRIITSISNNPTSRIVTSSTSTNPLSRIAISASGISCNPISRIVTSTSNVLSNPTPRTVTTSRAHTISKPVQAKVIRQMTHQTVKAAISAASAQPVSTSSISKGTITLTQVTTSFTSTTVTTASMQQRSNSLATSTTSVTNTVASTSSPSTSSEPAVVLNAHSSSLGPFILSSQHSGSRPSSTGSAHSLPSPKAVIANVNAAQFVSVSQVQLAAGTASPKPVQSPLVTQAKTVSNLLSQQQMLQHMISKPQVANLHAAQLSGAKTGATLVTSATIPQNVSTVKLLSTAVSQSGEVILNKSATNQQLLASAIGQPGLQNLQTIMIKQEAGNQIITTTPVCATATIGSTPKATIAAGSKPLVARIISNPQVMSVGNLIASTLAASQKQGGATIKIQGGNIVHPMTGKPGQMNVIQTNPGTTGLPRLAVVSQGAGGNLIPVTCATLNTQPKLVAASSSHLGMVASQLASQQNQLSAGNKPTLLTTQGGMKILSTSGQGVSIAQLSGKSGQTMVVTTKANTPTTIAVSVTPTTSTPQGVILTSSGQTSTPTVVLASQGALKPAQTVVMAAAGTAQTVVMAAQQGMRPIAAVTPVNVKALQSVKVIPVSQASSVKGKTQPVFARIITPPAGLTLRSANALAAQQGISVIQNMSGLSNVTTSTATVHPVTSLVGTSANPAQATIIRLQAAAPQTELNKDK